MDIDRMAKEWPKMIARIEALERRLPATDGQPQTVYTPDQVGEVQRAFEQLRQDAERIVGRLQEATAVLQHADQTLRAAALDEKLGPKVSSDL